MRTFMFTSGTGTAILMESKVLEINTSPNITLGTGDR